MVLTVKPKPLAPLFMMMGGFRLVTRGESSRHGDVSRELAVLDPPGEGIDCGESSAAEINKQYISTRMKKKITWLSP